MGLDWKQTPAPRRRGLTKQAYDLQSEISAARIDIEAKLHRGRTSGNFTEAQEKAVDAYRKSPEGRALSALWSLAGVVSEVAKETAALAEIVSEMAKAAMESESPTVGLGKTLPAEGDVEDIHGNIELGPPGVAREEIEGDQ